MTKIGDIVSFLISRKKVIYILQVEEKSATVCRKCGPFTCGHIFLKYLVKSNIFSYERKIHMFWHSKAPCSYRVRMVQIEIKHIKVILKMKHHYRH